MRHNGRKHHSIRSGGAPFELHCHHLGKRQQPQNSWNINYSIRFVKPGNARKCSMAACLRRAVSHRLRSQRRQVGESAMGPGSVGASDRRINPRQLWCQSSCQGPFRAPSPSAHTPHARPTPPTPLAHPLFHRRCKRVARHLLRCNSLGHGSYTSRPGEHSRPAHQAAFGPRISDFFRISAFGLRIYPAPGFAAKGLTGTISLTSLFQISQPFVCCRVRINTRSPSLGSPNRRTIELVA